MGRLEVLQKFISFLEENDALFPYINNLNRPLDTLLSTNRFIMGAFYWEKTAEGHNFWRDLSTKWVDISNDYPNYSYFLETVYDYLNSYIWKNL